MLKVKSIIVRILKCVICFLTGGFANRKNGGSDEAC